MKTLLVAASTIAVLVSSAASAERVSTNMMLQGSDIRLDRDGNDVRIEYVRPRPWTAAKGVRPGSLLFEGMILNDGSVGGRGYMFKAGCSPQPLALLGGVEFGELVLHYAPPVWDACTLLTPKAGEPVDAKLPFRGQPDLRRSERIAAETATATGKSGYVLPAMDATPTAIVDFLLRTRSKDIGWINDGQAMKRLLDDSLAIPWKRAESLGEPYMDGDWRSNDLDFEASSWTTEASDGRVAVAMHDKLGNRHETTYRFLYVAGAWRVADVEYDDFFDPKRDKVVPSLRRTLLDAIARHEGHDGDAVNVAKAQGLDLAKMTLRGERGTTYDHNGSEVVVFEKAGLVVYDNPKRSISATVKRGDVLFSGLITDKSVEGKAYTFKAGCDPAPYSVTGRWNRGGSIVLTGAAPVHARGGCAIDGYSRTSPNARLLIRSVIGDL